MSPITLMLLAGGVAATGQFVQGKPFSLKTGAGAIVATIMVGSLYDVDHKLGMGFATLILVGSMALYLDSIVKALGFTGASSGTTPIVPPPSPFSGGSTYN